MADTEVAEVTQAVGEVDYATAKVIATKLKILKRKLIDQIRET